MNPPILLVDDDRALLNSLTRNFSLDFDLRTAESGSDAIELIEREGAFSVALVDMRMPGMDGISFIQKAREIAPDTVYMMLTGNQDLGTAMQAVNEGQVFRFLSKPCEISAVGAALRAGLRQYELVTAEKELLQKTFVGAIGLMTDVIDVSRPGVSAQSELVESLMVSLAGAADVPLRWEYRIAARVALLGLALMPEEDAARFLRTPPSEPESERILEAICGATVRLTERIPRLGPVAEILRIVPHATGELWKDSAAMFPAVAGATLIRAAIHWTAMMRCRMAVSTAVPDLYRAMPRLPTAVAEALAPQTELFNDIRPVYLAVDELREGMTLYDDVTGEGGKVLLSRGRPLTQSIIEKLRLMLRSGESLSGIAVTDTSCPTADLAHL